MGKRWRSLAEHGNKAFLPAAAGRLKAAFTILQKTASASETKFGNKKTGSLFISGSKKLPLSVWRQVY